MVGILGRVGVVGLGIVLAACSSNSKSVGTTAIVATSPPRTASSVGAGPVVNVDHWHAAYGVYDCDRYLDSIDGSELADPDGIHTHADGLIHIHPFTDRASGANATLRRFTGVVGIGLAEDRLDVGVLKVARRNGDRCPNGKKGRVRILVFGGPTHSEPVEVANPLDLRLEQEQVIAIVFAPDGQLIGPPPSVSELDDPADVAVEFELTPERRALIGEQPTVEVPTGAKPDALIIKDIDIGTGDAVGPSSKVGVKFVLATWSAGTVVESNWDDSAPLLGLALGRDTVVKGFDQGMQGMRVGGLRRIIIPPKLGFGTVGSPPLIGPNETLVLYVRLVALQAPRFEVTGTTIAS